MEVHQTSLRGFFQTTFHSSAELSEHKLKMRGTEKANAFTTPALPGSLNSFRDIPVRFVGNRRGCRSETLDLDVVECRESCPDS